MNMMWLLRKQRMMNMIIDNYDSYVDYIKEFETD
jgi:hypothetical protein